MKDFDQKLDRLEQLSQEMQNGEVPLEKAVQLFEEGLKLAGGLEKDFTKLEKKVEILLSGAEVDPSESTPNLGLFDGEV